MCACRGGSTLGTFCIPSSGEAGYEQTHYHQVWRISCKIWLPNSGWHFLSCAPYLNLNEGFFFPTLWISFFWYLSFFIIWIMYSAVKSVSFFSIYVGPTLVACRWTYLGFRVKTEPQLIMCNGPLYLYFKSLHQLISVFFVFIKCFPTLSVSWPLAFAQGQVWCVYIDWACRTNWTNTFLCCARTARRQWLAPKSGNGFTCYSQASCYRHVTIVTSWTVSAIWDVVMIPWRKSIAIPTALMICARSI